MSPAESGVHAVKNRIAALIEANNLGPGGRLPPERTLVGQLRTSRWTVRRALDLLEAEGLIWRHVGQGTFVGPKPIAKIAQLHLLSEHTSPSDLIDARLVIEPQLAARAALYGSGAQVAAIRQAYHKSKTARNFEVYETWDEAFHRGIAKASGNHVLFAVFQAINELRREIIWGSMRNWVLRPQAREYFSVQHETILKAITIRDSNAAALAMHNHLRSLERTYSSVTADRQQGTDGDFIF